jgi:ADP-ribose pyrophosphatase
MSDIKPWKTLQTRVLFEREPWLRVLADDVELPDGRVVEDYLRLEAPDFVAIVAIHASGEVAMLRCYKHGVGTVDEQLPAGYIEGGEEPLETAKRELLEETGCVADDWRALGHFVISGNRGINTAHVFLANDCRQVDSPDSGDLEEQELFWMAQDELRRRLAAGSYQQILTVACLGLAFAYLDASEALR